MTEVKQCPTCPWKASCNPLTDIPRGYSVALHLLLKATIATPGAASLEEDRTGMACHYSKPGEEFPCAGWLHHQLGVGNNVRLRIQVIRGLLPVPIVEGEQHPTFEATLPDGLKRTS